MPNPCPHPAEAQRLLFGARDYITGEAFRIEQCGHCCVVFTRPPPAIQDLGKYYPSEYYGDGVGRFPRLVESLQRALYRRRAGAIQKMLGRPGKVLDIGCGPGLLLREFRERGWQVQGTEFSEQSAAHARDVLGLPISIGDIRELKLGDRSFDAIVMWHVLEHLPQPEEALAEVGRLLRPGGIFLCAVPNFGSAEARLARDKWFHLDVPRHLNHFTVEALRTLLSVHGLAVERTSFFSLEYDCFSFTQSVLNVLGLRHNLLFNLLRGARAKVLSGEPSPTWQNLASLVLAAPLGIFSVSTTTVAALLRTGATATVYARK